jgi:hypothetical protein
MVRTSCVSRRDDDRELEARLFDMALEAGAIRRCGNGHAEFYRAFDNRAEARAFSDAALAHSNGEFPAYRLDAIIGAVGSILDGAGILCGQCEAARATY